MIKIESLSWSNVSAQECCGIIRLLRATAMPFRFWGSSIASNASSVAGSTSKVFRVWLIVSSIPKFFTYFRNAHDGTIECTAKSLHFSLRRYDPDQVQRVTAVSHVPAECSCKLAVSQLLVGAPLGTPLM